MLRKLGLEVDEINEQRMAKNGVKRSTGIENQMLIK